MSLICKINQYGFLCPSTKKTVICTTQFLWKFGKVGLTRMELKPPPVECYKFFLIVFLKNLLTKNFSCLF